MITAYRVWDGEQMHYWDDEGISLTIEGGNWYLYRKDTEFITSNKTARTALMWGTGLKDNNKREIYEGDIWESYGRRFQVEFNEDRGGYFPFATDDGCGCCSDEVDSPYAGEVVGDVYQNPELLEGAE
ncbi:YopX family protein [Bacillus atrophaeus]|uniref:YopX family protein n=1 Tax=Bacillus atrophaeus TaxID=1452 RepID=UPI0038731313